MFLVFSPLTRTLISALEDKKMLCTVHQLGLVEYGEAYHLQRRLVRQRIEGQIPDTLLLLEHYPTFTIGKSGKVENLLVPKEELARQGISLFFTDRGGDITYHGPGQLVAYPVIDLRRRGKDIHKYVYDLEEVIIRTLADLSIKARKDANNVGVWVGNEEIAAIGVSIKKWVTMHGFALNVNSNLESFSLINPCGISGKRVTSISKLLSQDVPMELVIGRVTEHFSEVFDTRIEWVSNTSLRSRW